MITGVLIAITLLILLNFWLDEWDKIRLIKKTGCITALVTISKSTSVLTIQTNIRNRRAHKIKTTVTDNDMTVNECVKFLKAQGFEDVSIAKQNY
ncbi:hypothetical protein HB999_07615 [Listeria booriae]|uniref:hypothetical protein n=1 Tax=Listeria booriae TaxID=1552123 RepID=UPI00164E4EB7|nr:hypothetical protein [Listeria booriae]MBC6163334.1 hypothetical protein [Listeria booriae]